MRANKTAEMLFFIFPIQAYKKQYLDKKY